MNERNDVEFPVWRKKVDSSLLEDGYTPLPAWVQTLWVMNEKFPSERIGKSSNIGKVSIEYNRNCYEATITRSYRTGTNKFITRLNLCKQLTYELRLVYPVSYMRSYEAKLARDNASEGNAPTYKSIEKDSSKWEFLDIEFDTENSRFIFTSHFVLTPEFPNLYNAIIGRFPTPKALKKASLNGAFRKYKWLPRSEFRKLIHAKNVIYTLMNSKTNEFYIGRAADLQKRYNGKSAHHAIPDWDFFRYNELSEELIPYIDQIERMLIADANALCDSPLDEKINVCLKNSRIDDLI
ncbi:hypothetical protein J7G20_002488 [Vibrio parahaemolyticus]|nr:hypothetical protein [Vibrio parahaemolyticus]HCG7218183.1 hypothetical protein [Vibrio parahaemolyticus]